MFDIFCGAKALSALHVQRFCSGYFLVSVVVMVALSSLVALPRETIYFIILFILFYYFATHNELQAE